MISGPWLALESTHTDGGKRWRPGPPKRQLHGIPGLLLRRWKGRTFIEDHDNIRTQVSLHRHGGFRTEKDLVAIHRRAKGDAGIANLSQITETEYLEAARVCENWLRPAHKIVEAAMLLNNLTAWPEHQVEGIT